MENSGENNSFLDAVYKAIDKKIANSRKEQAEIIKESSKRVKLSEKKSEESTNSISKNENGDDKVLAFYKMGAYYKSIPTVFMADKKEDKDDKNFYIDNNDNRIAYIKTI